MNRSYPEKVYLKNRTENSFRDFKKQKKTFVGGCIKKKENFFFNSLNSSFVKDKLFSKSVESFFSSKVDHGSNIQLVAPPPPIKGGRDC